MHGCNPNHDGSGLRLNDDPGVKLSSDACLWLGPLCVNLMFSLALSFFQSWFFLCFIIVCAVFFVISNIVLRNVLHELFSMAFQLPS